VGDTVGMREGEFNGEGDLLGNLGFEGR